MTTKRGLQAPGIAGRCLVAAPLPPSFICNSCPSSQVTLWAGRRRIGDGVLHPVQLSEAHTTSNQSECSRLLAAGHVVQDEKVSLPLCAAAVSV